MATLKTSQSRILTAPKKASAFPTPSKACNRQRGLYQNTAIPTGGGQVYEGRDNRGVFKKSPFSACPR